MVNKQIITKSKKYMLQFPESVSTDDQKKYLQSVSKSFEESDLVVIDSKIKIYSKEEHFEKELPEDEKVDDKASDKKDDKVDDKPPANIPPKEVAKSDEVKVEKVGTDVPPPKEPTVQDELLGE